MMKRIAFFAGLLVLVMGLVSWTRPFPSQAAPATAAPVLKWAEGGCYSSWCETGWYASPAVADLDGDGKMEVLGGGYTLFVLNGEDGSEQWHADAPGSGGRMWPGVVVADIDNDGDLEVVTAHGGGYVRVLSHSGSQVWQRRPATRELRGLAVYDLDDDGTLEVIVNAAIGSKTNTWVYEHDGTLRPGWPQLTNDSGYAYGVFNDNTAVADLDGDQAGAELVVPSDVHYINAYEPGGAQIPAHAMYGGKGWGKVGIWEDLAIELRGWGDCSSTRAERYRTNFAHGAAVIADMNGDGINEVVVTGNVYDCAIGHPPGKYNGVYVFNADRSRFDQGGYDWQTLPVDTGAPLSEDYGVIENNQPNPAVADLDGDGEREIIYSSYDGSIHAFWLDKTEHHNWPYDVYSAGEGFYRFAGEPVIVDLENDGTAEVIAASWPQKGGNRTGKLHILDYQGNVINEIPLPPPYSGDWNGALAAPTVANIDADADLELILNTAHSGLVAYDLPGSAGARILWGTGRGGYLRSGSLLPLQHVEKSVMPLVVGPGGMLTYTIRLAHPGPETPQISVTDALPSGLTFSGYLWASSGTAQENSGTISWDGLVPAGGVVEIRFAAEVDAAISEPQIIMNTATVTDGYGFVEIPSAGIVVSGTAVYLPVISRQ